MPRLLVAVSAALACWMTPHQAVAELAGDVSLEPAALIDLTAEGATDWAAWGCDPEGRTSDLSAFSRKSDGDGGVVGAIPDPTDLNDLLVGDPLYDCGGCAGIASRIGFSWTDGESVASADNLVGDLLFRRQGVGGGFSLSLPATETTQRLTLYVSAFRAASELTATLSDGSGSYTDTSITHDPPSFEDQLGVYTLDYASDVAATTLDITFAVTEDRGNFESVGLLAATLAPLVLDPPGLTGDYNGDGFVDAADYTIWRDSEDTVGVDLPADGDGDGVIDPDDYDLWVANFGTTSEAAAAVPEPAAATLIALLAISPITRRRTR